MLSEAAVHNIKNSSFLLYRTDQRQTIPIVYTTVFTQEFRLSNFYCILQQNSIFNSRAALQLIRNKWQFGRMERVQSTPWSFIPHFVDTYSITNSACKHAKMPGITINPTFYSVWGGSTKRLKIKHEYLTVFILPWSNVIETLAARKF